MSHRGPFQPLPFCDSVNIPWVLVQPWARWTPSCPEGAE